MASSSDEFALLIYSDLAEKHPKNEFSYFISLSGGKDIKTCIIYIYIFLVCLALLSKNNESVSTV